MARFRNLIIMIMTVTLMALTAVTGWSRAVTEVSHPDFRTLRIYASEAGELGDPVVMLDGGELTVEFDELSSERRYMRYSLTHCNADWQPSGLVESEYLEGFNEGTIDDYDFSRATTVQYIHYRFTLPNEQVRFTVSGNYILRVYDEENPGETLLEARFRVVERKVQLKDAQVTSRTDVDYNDRHQQLAFTIEADDLAVRDPFNDFTVIVTQNNCPSTAVTIPHPLSVSGRGLVYEHLPQLVFPAGNEYRRFETVTLRMPGMNVAGTEFHAPYYHALVGPDEPRADRPYLYDSTQHGRYVVRDRETDRPETEADYVVTHFSLRSGPVDNALVYVEGDLTSRSPAGRATMEYNSLTGCYETALLLKQGSYNYRYLIDDGEGNLSPSAIEGDFYNTTNEYQVAVYYRLPGDRYDRLVGYFILNSF